MKVWTTIQLFLLPCLMLARHVQGDRNDKGKYSYVSYKEWKGREMTPRQPASAQHSVSATTTTLQQSQKRWLNPKWSYPKTRYVAPNIMRPTRYRRRRVYRVYRARFYRPYRGGNTAHRYYSYKTQPAYYKFPYSRYRFGQGYMRYGYPYYGKWNYRYRLGYGGYRRYRYPYYRKWKVWPKRPCIPHTKKPTFSPSQTTTTTQVLTSVPPTTTTTQPTILSTKASTTKQQLTCNPDENRCQESCTCKDGKFVDCYRVRKEFSQLSSEEKRRFLDVVVYASTRKPYKKQYEALVTKHMEIFHMVHNITYFLPWHRWYLLQYENLLRQLDCRITVPYWDSSLVAASPFTSDFWADSNGFGGNGVAPSFCVQSGFFGVKAGWRMARSAGGGCLQRSFMTTPGVIPNIVQVAKVLAKNLSDFSDFELMLRINLHDSVHSAIGGTMFTFNSAAAPEFAVHHSFVDKLWNDWQNKSDSHKFHQFFLEQKNNMPGTNFKAVDFLDNSNLPDGVKVKYEEPQLGEWGTLINKLKNVAETNPKKLDSIPGLPSAKLNTEIFKAFNVADKEIKRAMEMHKELETKITLDRADLKGMETMIGFKLSDLKALQFLNTFLKT